MVDFFVRSDLFECGLDVDGSTVEGLNFFVVAEFEDGSRLASPKSFSNRGTRQNCSETGEPYWPHQDWAEETAERYLEHVEKFAQDNEPTWERLFGAGWMDIDPRYGSPAYQDDEAAGLFAEGP